MDWFIPFAAFIASIPLVGSMVVMMICMARGVPSDYAEKITKEALFSSGKLATVAIFVAAAILFLRGGQ